jgi:hypothetical protein
MTIVVTFISDGRSYEINDLYVMLLVFIIVYCGTNIIMKVLEKHGIIASAAGGLFADSTDRPSTLPIGDVAALHDMNFLHALRTSMKESQAHKIHPLTIIVLLFGTPTNTFSLEKGAAAFDLPFERVVNPESFQRIYSKAIALGEHSSCQILSSKYSTSI